MTLLDDFNKTHPNLKEILLGILFVGGFWFIDLYLFHRAFFNSSPIYLPITFSLCLSMCSLIPNCLTMLFAIPNYKRFPDENFPIFFGILLSIISMGIFTAIGYWLSFKMTAYLKLVFYGESIFLILIMTGYVLKTRNNKDAKQSAI